MSDKTSEILEVPYHYIGDYLYTYGELSPFFREVMENKRLMATRCTQCGTVWCPPRVDCSKCYGTTEWIPLSGKGTVIACTHVYYMPNSWEMLKWMDLPYVLAVIQMDGADVGMLHTVITGEQQLGSVQAGTRVQVEFREERNGTIIDYYFVPEKAG